MIAVRVARFALVSVLVLAVPRLSPVLAQETAVAPLSDAQQAALAALLAATSDAEREAAARGAGPALSAPVVAAAFDEGLSRRRAADVAGSNSAFDAARVAAAVLGLRRDEARAWLQLAQNAARAGHFDQATGALDAAERLSRAENDQATLAAAIGNRGIVARMRGDLDLASRYYAEGVRLAEQVGQPAMQASAWNNLGNVHMQRGDYAAAVAALLRSQQLNPRDDLTKARTYGNLGVVYSAQGDYDLAIASYERQLAMLHALGEQADEGVVVLMLAITLRDAGRLDEAMATFARSEQRLRAASNAFDMQTLLFERGETLLRLGRVAEADADFAAALAASRNMGEKPGEASALTLIAEIRLRQERVVEALESSAAAVTIARDIGNLAILDDAWSVHGRALAASGRLDESMAAFDAAIDAVERQRSTVAGDDAARARFFADHVRPYHDAIDTLDRAGMRDLALAYADRARARTFVEVLTRGRVAVDGALDAGERDERDRLEQRLADAQRGVVVATTPGTLGGRLPAADASVTDARRAIADFRARAVARHPELRLIDAPAQLIQPSDLSRVVGGDTVIVAFSVLPTRIRVSMLSRAQPRRDVAHVSYDVRVTRQTLASQVEAFRTAIARRDLGVALQAREWYARLFGDAPSAFARAGRVIVVPDAELWDLPMQALQDAGGRYLVERASVTYAPSLAALLAITDVQANALPAADAASLVPLVAFASPGPVAGGGVPLPEAVRQVEAIAQRYGPGAHVDTGAGATEANVETWAPRARVLHLAAHGLLDADNPLYSWLALKPEPDGAADDGRFEARELLRLRLRADLVVLSACESARGAVTAGEGMVGLAWATLVAGARNVVVSQWKVDAAATEQLMVRFHAVVTAPPRPGETVDLGTALRTASLSLLAQPATRHPYYWAGFALVGSGSMPHRRGQ